MIAKIKRGLLKTLLIGAITLSHINCNKTYKVEGLENTFGKIHSESDGIFKSTSLSIHPRYPATIKKIYNKDYTFDYEVIIERTAPSYECTYFDTDNDGDVEHAFLQNYPLMGRLVSGHFNEKKDKKEFKYLFKEINRDYLEHRKRFSQLRYDQELNKKEN